ncbi:MAG: dihydrofolate reductase [Dehalococcoidia bacterium]|jgi:dihydrofolate reductase|nr:dihydrofolate reductase [Dehalococcoidia bacterium]
MEKIIIAAASENNVIGNKGKLPWEIPEDTKRFKKLTLYHPVIMGRRTYYSIPEEHRPLPNRTNIVLSKDMEPTRGVHIARNLDEALRFSESMDTYIIGGESIYKSFLSLADKIELTRVHIECEGDAFFPEINNNEWIQEEKQLRTHEDLQFSYITYHRKKD